jgi:hypothetical protein
MLGKMRGAIRGAVASLLRRGEAEVEGAGGAVPPEDEAAKSPDPAKAAAYLIKCGAQELLDRAGREPAPPDQVVDLAFLHRLMLAKRPDTVLEFGCGRSTIIIAHALMRNAEQHPARESPKLFAVEAYQPWLEGLRQGFPDELRPFVDLRFSPCSIRELNGQVCHTYDALPNIEPRIIYLDGPNPRDVHGDANGLTFIPERGRVRPLISADVLLYEWTLRRGAILVVDGRGNNVRFLISNLRRKWRIIPNEAERRTVFELLE